MGTPYLSPYEDPATHARISAIIRRRSSNPLDVREALLEGIPLEKVRELLDLGCGFGFWAEALAGRVAPDAYFTGMDACQGNEHVYQRLVQAQGRRARFICTNLVSRLPFDDASFDLVVAGYSLYFFVHVLAEVRRVLRPSGRLLAVTHSEESYRGLLRAIGLADGDSPLVWRIRAFSAENGAAILAPRFAPVARSDYENALSFYEEDRADFLEYLRFKLPLLQPGACYADGLPAPLVERAAAALRRGGLVTVRKDDALFACGGCDAH